MQSLQIISIIIIIIIVCKLQKEPSGALYTASKNHNDKDKLSWTISNTNMIILTISNTNPILKLNPNKGNINDKDNLHRLSFEWVKLNPLSIMHEGTRVQATIKSDI